MAVDDVEGVLYAKRYTLRGVGDKIEVWVASDTDEVSSGTRFPTDAAATPSRAAPT